MLHEVLSQDYNVGNELKVDCKFEKEMTCHAHTEDEWSCDHLIKESKTKGMTLKKVAKWRCISGCIHGEEGRQQMFAVEDNNANMCTTKHVNDDDEASDSKPAAHTQIKSQIVRTVGEEEHDSDNMEQVSPLDPLFEERWFQDLVLRRQIPIKM